MNENEVFIRILITIILGAILGLETETRAIEIQGKAKAKKVAKQKLGGLRTYTVLSLFGGVAGIFHLAKEYYLVYILFISVIAFTLAAYVLNVRLKKAFGLTTEIAIIITFALGFLTTSSLVPIQVVLLIIVLLTFFLSQKRGIGAAIEKIQHREVIDIIKFSLISIAILPLLPNQDYTLGQVMNVFDPTLQLNNSISNLALLNPFLTWLLVVLISGINLLGYVLSKFLGKRLGVFIAGVFGGMVSSTSAVASLAMKSKEENSKQTSKLLAGVALISNSFSFVTIGLLMLISSRVLFMELSLVMLIIMISGIIIGLYLIRNEKKYTKESSRENLGLKYQPFSVGPALKFVSLILIIKIAIQLLIIFSQSRTLFVLISSLSGLTGMDAVVIAFGDLVQKGSLSVSGGILAFMFANCINFVGKSVFSFINGDRYYFKYLSLGLLIVGLLGLLGLLV